MDSPESRACRNRRDRGRVAVQYFRPVPIPVTVTEVRTGRVEDLVTNNKAGTITRDDRRR